MLEATVHEEAQAALNRLHHQHPGLDKELDKAYAYVVFPSVGRGGVVIGGAYGHGEVYEQKRPVGFATLSQITVGVQVGGQTFTEVVIFNKKEAFEDFKRKGRVGFSAHASAVALKAAASGTTNFADVVAHAYSSGGMLLEASLGGSKMMFIPPMEKDGQGDGKQNRKTSPQEEKEEVNVDETDIVGGSIGRQALEKLSSRPVIGRLISSLRFISPILPHKKGEKNPVGKFADQLSSVRTEKAVGDILHDDVQAALHSIREKDQKAGDKLKKAYGYAVFPAVGGASAVVGGATGKGEVFEKGKLVGYAQLIQVTIGVQLGGQTYTEVVLFSGKAGLDRFRKGKVSFAANAAAVIVKAGAVVTTKYQGHEILIYSDGGLLIEAALGGQKFVFKPAVLTKGKSDHQEHGEDRSGSSESQSKDQQSKDQQGKDQKDDRSGPEKIGRFDVEVVR